jgi:hypothetical protein
MQHHYVDCQCSDFGHVIRFVMDEEDGELWLEVHMNHYEPWYKRIWNAVKYVLKKDVAYGHYDVTMLRNEDLVKLHDLFDRSSLLRRSHGTAQEKPLLKG